MPYHNGLFSLILLVISFTSMAPHFLNSGEYAPLSRFVKCLPNC
jgi:hypothetical protein